MTGQATARALESLARPLRLWQRAGWAAALTGTMILSLGAWAWIVRLRVLDAPWWVLAAWAVAIAAAAAILVAAWRQEPKLRLPAVARALEDGGTWRRGALVALLEVPAAGTSDALRGLADQHRATDLAQRGPAAVTPLVRQAGRRCVVGLGVLALGLAVLGAAGPRQGVAAALWHPRRAWEMTVAPVRLAAASGVIDRGQPVALDIEAIGRRHAILWLRVTGERWRPT
ncbi:MAG TPA: hypothetical protein VFM14_06785, partial [Gemmatimonadales bacterium]|nr:hypothetical protein [Gemmatimonadales bacterium]